MTDTVATSDLADPGPAATKGERTRHRLLSIAVERFGDRGLRSTSVSEIARAAGLTQAAVYAYFSNKDDLFAAAVDADATVLFDEIHAGLVDVPVTDVVPTIIILAFTGLDDHPLTKRVLAGHEPEALGRLVDLPALRRVSGYLADELRRGQTIGQVRADIDPVVLADGLESLVLGLLFSTVQTGGLATPRHQAGVVAAFDAMLAPPR